jgi:hypothetical protein
MRPLLQEGEVKSRHQRQNGGVPCWQLLLDQLSFNSGICGNSDPEGIRVLLAANPTFNQKKKETPNEHVSVHY